MFIQFKKRKPLTKNKKASPFIENRHLLSRNLFDISRSAPELLTKHDINPHIIHSLYTLTYLNDKKPLLRQLESRMILSRGKVNNMKAFHDDSIFPIKSEPSKNRRIRRKLY